VLCPSITHPSAITSFFRVRATERPRTSCKVSNNVAACFKINAIILCPNNVIPKKLQVNVEVSAVRYSLVHFYLTLIL
jgi:hypothetical protein